MFKWKKFNCQCWCHQLQQHKYKKKVVSAEDKGEKVANFA